MISIMGVEYGRGCLAVASDSACARAPAAVKKMFPGGDWTTVIADPFNPGECARDRFGENFKIQKKIYAATPFDRHIMIGGDHSVNFGHFAALADRMDDEELCLIYIDAHLDIHTPETARAQASGAPHGTNVRALLGEGDERWLSLVRRHPALRPQNVFYLGVRSWEDAEIQFVQKNNIFMRTAAQLRTKRDLQSAVNAVRMAIDARPYVISFDFDAIDPKYFKDVLVPAAGGITPDAAEFLLREFVHDAHSFEFVEYAPSGDKQSEDIVRNLVSIAVND